MFFKQGLFFITVVVFFSSDYAFCQNDSTEDASSYVLNLMKELYSIAHSDQGDNKRFSDLKNLITKNTNSDKIFPQIFASYWNTLDESQKKRLSSGYYNYTVEKYFDALEHYTGAIKIINSSKVNQFSFPTYSVFAKIKILHDEQEKIIDLKFLISFDNGKFAILDIMVDNAIQVSKVLQRKFDKAVNRVGIDEVISALETIDENIDIV
ncbi:MAG: hypothetical protein P857_942 [Candidatus Xenolissoclinum pacificiensis L6]|uniref:Toluene tolerance, Ttg2 family protein n=1 Tax=Candidatus Xenolissoclinum pacificiensis L6 TaxID=1401685 RepID=W2V295_9RICK|nr:MAG: hypothetical protein P857_942 [Candidatus Xenolissoclinum pacificiensis L6]